MEFLIKAVPNDLCQPIEPLIITACVLIVLAAIVWVYRLIMKGVDRRAENWLQEQSKSGHVHYK